MNSAAAAVATAMATATAATTALLDELSVATLTSSGFAIVPELSGQTITLRFRGNADMASVEPLDDLLRKVHSLISSRKLPSVTVDFRALEFMNSSCFKCFVEWLGNVQDLPPEKRYRVVFDSNRGMHWQRRSLNALRCFAMDVVTIESR